MLSKRKSVYKYLTSKARKSTVSEGVNFSDHLEKSEAVLLHIMSANRAVSLFYARIHSYTVCVVTLL